MNGETQTHISPQQLLTHDLSAFLLLPDFLELEGVVGVPERRTSGKVVLS